MWTITDKQIKAISESLKKEAEKLIDKYSSTEELSVTDNDMVSQEESSQNGTDNESVSQLNSSEGNYLDNNSGSVNKTSKNKANNTQDNSDVILPCEAIEVDFITGERPEANDEEFEVVILYKNNNEEDVEEKFENQIVEKDVFSKIHLIVRYPNGKEMENYKMEWYIKKGTKEEIELKSATEIIGTSETKKLTGSEIYFPVPKEWGKKKTYTITALRTDLNVKKTIQLDIKDHIAAAFFRLETKKYETQNITIKEKLGGIPLKDLYHHQGLYRDGNTFYISVSTYPKTPSYIYISGDKKEHIILDKGVLSQYTHPGGIQVADGLLAIGLEKYTEILPFSTQFISVICFFDLNNGNEELTDLRIVLDKDYDNKVKRIAKTDDNIDKEISEKPQNKSIRDNRASALGIVKRENDYIVANRGTGSNIDFYKISSDRQSITQIGETLKAVGDFQNINLFLYKDDVYLFGMGNENGKMGGTTHVYRIFHEEEPGQPKINGNHIPLDIENSRYNVHKEVRKRDNPIYARLENLPIPYGEDFSIDYDSVYGSHSRNGYHKKVTVCKYMIEDTEIVPQSVCRIFKVNNLDSTPSLESVWIDEDGYLKTQLYSSGEVNNKIRFYCQEDTDPRFHWASCLYLQDNNMESDDKEGEKGKEKEFEGRFTLYTVGAGVSNKKISSIFFKEKEEK